MHALIRLQLQVANGIEGHHNQKHSNLQLFTICPKEMADPSLTMNFTVNVDYLKVPHCPRKHRRGNFAWESGGHLFSVIVHSTINVARKKNNYILLVPWNEVTSFGNQPWGFNIHTL